eukprot:6153331-Pyramimonas_sp.AAC.1
MRVSPFARRTPAMSRSSRWRRLALGPEASRRRTAGERLAPRANEKNRAIGAIERGRAVLEGAPARSMQRGVERAGRRRGRHRRPPPSKTHSAAPHARPGLPA